LTTFNATNNDSLECIETLDPTYATENWTYENGNIDEGATFAVNCTPFFGPVYHVSNTGSDETGNGSEDFPFATIQNGIDSSSDGDTVLVAAGTYVENINFNGKNIAVIGADSSNTIIDGNQSGVVVTFMGNEDSTAMLSGFTISGGFSTDVGGIICIASSPTLTSLMISDNSTTLDGGGVYLWGSNTTLMNVTISGNSASNNGGGIFCGGNSNPTITNVIVSGNTATNGGGIYCENSNITITDVTINGNSAGNSGGGLFINDSTFTVNNAIISSNTASNDGGGIRCQNSSELNISFSAITNNSCDSGGGGIAFSESTSNLVNVSIINNNDSFDAGLFVGEGSSVVLNNSLNYGNDIYFYGDGNTIQISYSNIQGGYEGEGNIDADPFFCNPDSGDYTLAENSPCVGTGENGTNIGAFGVGCEEINLAPLLATIEDQQIAEDSILTIGVSATSYLGYSMSFTATSETSDVEVSLEDTNLTAIPSLNWFGSSVITVIATDENELFDTTGFTLTVNAVNDAPVANNDTIMVDHNTDYVGQISWSDVDGDMEFSCNLLSSPSNGTANVSVEGSFVYSPTIDYSGNDSFTFTVCDNSLCDTATVFITIHALSVDELSLPTEYAIHQNYPNPFNPVTTLRYDLPENGLVNIIIYDMLGKNVKTLINQTQDAGYKSVIWDATNDYGKPVSAGIYLYQIQAGEYIQTKKMVLLK